MANNKLIKLNKNNIELIPKTRNAVRKWLFNNELISSKQQIYWYFNNYIKSSIKIYLCYKEKEYIGYCQIDSKTNEIGIYLEPKFQGFGYGSEFLNLLLKKIPNTKVIAKIKSDNIQSINLFKKAGFKIEHTVIENCQFIPVYLHRG